MFIPHSFSGSMTWLQTCILNSFFNTLQMYLCCYGGTPPLFELDVELHVDNVRCLDRVLTSAWRITSKSCKSGCLSISFVFGLSSGSGRNIFWISSHYKTIHNAKYT